MVKKKNPDTFIWELWDGDGVPQSGIACPEDTIKEDMIEELFLDQDEGEEYTLELSWGPLGERIAELTDSDGMEVGMAISR